RILIDGGATNPLPFDQLRGRADVIVAVDISGEGSEDRRDIPTPWECLVTTVLVMGTAITREKLKHVAPDLMVRPKVGIFRTLDFLQTSAILRAAEPAKQEIKDKLATLLDGWAYLTSQRLGSHGGVGWFSVGQDWRGSQTFNPRVTHRLRPMVGYAWIKCQPHNKGRG